MVDSLEIAQQAKLEPINDIAKKLGIELSELDPRGHFKAKIPLTLRDRLQDRKDGKYILVTAITPTPFGEGKTTTSIGLTQALGKLGKRVVVVLRQPSLGPVFGIKGGAAGAGYSQVVPMEEINLHFTGDIHAVGAAHNLLAAMLDNHIQKGNKLDIDVTAINLRRVMDMNDRALRQMVIGLGGWANGLPREDGFDITAASEVMAILALATGYQDLKDKLGKITVARDRSGKRITAADLEAHGAMAAVLKEAMMPNLVQTLEGQPAIIHAGPFANIAHGNSSIVADQMAMKLCDIVITEGGFGADLGAEKFFNIKCRKSGMYPNAVVLVTTVRAMKMHGGAFSIRPGQRLNPELVASENVDAVIKGGENLAAHIENMKSFGVPVIVAINKYPQDHDSELAAVKKLAIEAGADGCELSEVVLKGSEGGIELANAVLKAIEGESPEPKFTYSDNETIAAKIEKIATSIYGADGVAYTPKAKMALQKLEKEPGLLVLPVCMAKTHLSISDDPSAKGRPKDFTITIDDIRISSGAGFIYPILGKMLTMPGLPPRPSACDIDIDENGKIIGLF